MFVKLFVELVWGTLYNSVLLFVKKILYTTLTLPLFSEINVDTEKAKAFGPAFLTPAQCVDPAPSLELR